MRVEQHLTSIDMNRLRLKLGQRLVLCFALIIFSMFAADAVILWQFQIVRVQAEQLNGYDAALGSVLRVHSDLLRFRDTLESFSNEKNTTNLKL